MTILGTLIGREIARFAERFSKREIRREDSRPYLTRYYLLGPRESESGDGARPFNVYLHHFHASDEPSSLLHNHPWSYSASLILTGGYVEERLEADGKTIARKHYGPGSINRLAANDFHRVELVDKDAWTLFVSGPRVQSWGFRDIQSGFFQWWNELASHVCGWCKDCAGVGVPKPRSITDNETGKTKVEPSGELVADCPVCGSTPELRTFHYENQWEEGFE